MLVLEDCFSKKLNFTVLEGCWYMDFLAKLFIWSLVGESREVLLMDRDLNLEP